MVTPADPPLASVFLRHLEREVAASHATASRCRNNEEMALLRRGGEDSSESRRWKSSEERVSPCHAQARVSVADLTFTLLRSPVGNKLHFTDHSPPKKEPGTQCSQDRGISSSFLQSKNIH